MQLTWLDSNSWLIQTKEKNILLDPWLTGSLVFGNAPWFFSGEKQQKFPLPKKIDLILLSQGLEDHAHVPTLKQLDHNIPVVASPNAAQVVNGLGYKTVTTLAHQEKITVDNSIEIEAVPGSLVGPQLVENGYFLTDLTNNQNLYYEPHGFHSPTIQDKGSVDIAITPLVDFKILNLIPILKGQKSALQLCQWLQPKVILPSGGAGDIVYKGILASILNESGSIDRLRQLLQGNNLSTQIITPQPGEPVDISTNILDGNTQAIVEVK